MQMKAKIPNLTPLQRAQILGDPVLQSIPNAPVEVINALGGLHTLYSYSPRRLISLWDMIEFDIRNLLATLELLHAAKILAQEQFPEEGDAFENFVKNLMQRVNSLSQQARRLELIKTEGRCDDFADELLGICFSEGWNLTATSFDILPPQAIIREIDGIEKTVRDELEKKLFAFVPSAKAVFFEQEELFGKAVKDAATAELNGEIKAAGNCLAADLNTAAVFHLMRVAEHGLHALAIHLRAWPATRTSLEYSEWGEVLKAIRDVLNDRRNALPPGRGSAKEKEQRFYDGLLADLAYFLHDRNPVSHLRGHYEADEAVPIFRKVGDFIKRLPPRVPLK